MEGFLSTLPTYVHNYLDRYPPTDVFNVLKELVCFAVLYSDDRNRLKQSTREYLHKRNQRQIDAYNYYETESETEDLRDDLYLDDLKSPTLEEWWESESPKVKEPPTNNKGNNNLRRMERAKSQIIPDLRPYLEEGHTRMVTSGTPSALANKRHSMINMKTSSQSLTNSPRINPVTTNRIMSRSVSVSPVPSSIRNNAPRMTISSSTGTRSPSVQLKQPRINAATRARAEHARLQQQELEKKKNTPPPGSAISQRIKQRASSGIDWDTIKKTRRKTLLLQDDDEFF